MSDLIDRLKLMPKSFPGLQVCDEAAGRIEALEAALRLAEDVLSRAPFSTDIWPNGMHPQRGITIIREALAPEQDK